VAEIRYEVLAEEDVTDTQRRLAGALLHEVFGKKRVRRRGWVLHRPAYRVLVWDGDDLVGAEMGCHVRCAPLIDLHGFGDAAVREDARGRGIARRKWFGEPVAPLVIKQRF
jgi:GNAT superfamily N-acetyltransferase